MIARPYWITDQIAIVPRPRDEDWLDSEMLALREAGIDLVVSLLEKDEAEELGLQQESAAADQAGISFLRFPIPDRSVPPDSEAFNHLLAALEQQLSTGKRIGVHCRACIGRSSVVTVGLLVRSGIPHEAAWDQVTNARGCMVPDTDEQWNWVNRNIKANARG
ncbi:MAG: dual specificity protein phosphatase family protein [Acidobacteria bacterium]|nr:dual specificity protein phosphatase family protein [Acidobacteriota bacterium]